MYSAYSAQPLACDSSRKSITLLRKTSNKCCKEWVQYHDNDKPSASVNSALQSLADVACRTDMVTTNQLSKHLGFKVSVF